MQALFACLAYGHTENADENAVHNILAAGRAVWAARSDAYASGGRPRQARKGKGPACSRDEAGTHRGDHGCSSRGAVGIPVPSGLGGRQNPLVRYLFLRSNQVCLRPERANNRAGMLKQNVDGESYSVIPMAFM
jgi:hypothetical protein